MPNVWVHATLDLICYGRPYFDLHQQKDAPSKEMGINHRSVHHVWYQFYDKVWTMRDPFPKVLMEYEEELRKSLSGEQLEEIQSYTSHDYHDRGWNNLSESERWYCEGFCFWLLNNPALLRDWAGVDVIDGKIQREVDGKQIWEYEPAVIVEYKRLKAYADKVFQRKPPAFHQLYRLASSA